MKGQLGSGVEEYQIPFLLGVKIWQKENIRNGLRKKT